MKLLLVDSHHGIYIPQVFAEIYTKSIHEYDKLSESVRDALAVIKNPNNPEYWEAWQEVEDNVKIATTEGEVLTLYHDGDLWAISEGESFDEEEDYEHGEAKVLPKTIMQAKKEAGEHTLDEEYNAGLLGND